VAQTRDELELVYGFRYRIYVEEMGRKQKYADHERRRIQDPLDSGAINLAAFREDGIVGLCRINFPRDSDIGQYEEFYAMSTVGDDHPSSTSINTRLMIAPELRASRLGIKLAMASYEYGVPKGIKWNFIDCNDHLVPFFTALGYVQHVPKAQHEEYGLVTRMRLDVRNLAHLSTLRSPFASMLPRLLPTDVLPM